MANSSSDFSTLGSCTYNASMALWLEIDVAEDDDGRGILVNWSFGGFKSPHTEPGCMSEKLKIPRLNMEFNIDLRDFQVNVLGASSMYPKSAVYWGIV